MRLLNLGPIAFLSTFKLTASSGEHLEEISHARIVSLMYKQLTWKRGSDDLFIGFNRDRGKGKAEMASNEKIKGTYRLRNMLNDIFGFAER